MKKRGFQSREKESKFNLFRKDAIILAVTFLVFILAMFNLANITGRQVGDTFTNLVGDANLDGEVNVIDSMFIAQYVNGLRQLNNSQLEAADVNQDMKVTMEDAQTIAEYKVVKIQQLPVPAPTPPTKPYVPSRLKAVPDNYSSAVVLTWVDNADNEEGFKIYRAQEGTNTWTQIATVPANTLTYTDRETAENTGYSYRVESYNIIGDSIQGSTTYAKTNKLAFAAPENVKATALSPTQIEVSWNDTYNEIGYKLERKKEVSTIWAERANLPINITTYIDKITESGSYCYRIKAYNLTETSQPSAEACSATCADECISDEQKCSATTTYQTCGNYDRDTCLEWGTPRNCGQGQNCVIGTCISNAIEICDNEIDDDGDSFEDELDSECEESGDKPLLKVNLAKNYYIPGQTIDGNITITFRENIKSDSELKITLKSSESTIKTTDYLNEYGINYSVREEKIQLNNPQQIKNIELETGKEFLIGLKLPKSANIDNITMKVWGDNSRPTKGLSFDIPDENNKIEWKYIGNPLSTYGTPSTAKTLAINAEGNAQYLDSDSMHYCQEMNLSYAKDFLISAKYSSPTNTNANLEAAILSFDGTTAYGGGERCSLPKGSPTSTWHSCNINLQRGISGYYLVCLKVDSSERSYEISRDNSQTDSRYNCEIQEDEDFSYAYCTPLTSRNYFIKASPRLYNNYLNETIQPEHFNDWTTDSSLAESLTSYLTSCEEDNIGDCYVTIKIKSENSGHTVLNNLKIEYTEYEGGSSYANTFYDANILKPEIYSINNKELKNLTTTIQLSLFNLTAPNSTKRENLSLHLEFEGAETYASVQVYPEQGTQDLSSDQIVRDFETKMNKVKTHEINWVVDIDTGLELLDKYKEDIEKIKNSNRPSDMKEEAIKQIRNNMANSFAKTPENVQTLKTVKEEVVVVPSDLQQLFGEKESALLNFQNHADVLVEVKNYEVMNYDGSTNFYSTINKEIKLDKELKDVYVYEIIPKGRARSVSEIIFKTQGYEIEKEDPVIKYYYPSLSSATITYAVKSTVLQNEIYDFKSVILPKEIPEEPEREITSGITSRCGDGVCGRPEEDPEICPEDCKLKRKTPWLWILVLGFVLVAGILYLNFYRGRLSMNKLIRKNLPFNSEQDLEKVKNYITIQTRKRVRKTEISKSLLEKGWTKEQVEYAFEDISWDKKRDTLISNTPNVDDNMKKLEVYINKCRGLNIPDDKIIHNLKAKGWSGVDIEETIGHKANASSEKKETKLFFEE